MPPSSTLTVFSGLIQPYSFSLISKYQLTAFGCLPRGLLSPCCLRMASTQARSWLCEGAYPRDSCRSTQRISVSSWLFGIRWWAWIRSFLLA
ncbi:Uncharacterized protein HZ326_29678 [Fusarium oxysporum f. sp. albedinis]|nr:Uncharacterized protein HZ326_29678 [Fusarium oxysporum f. sp. albedinis]